MAGNGWREGVGGKQVAGKYISANVCHATSAYTRPKRTFRPTLDQKVYFGLVVAENSHFGQVPTFLAKARPKSLLRPRGGRKHPFQPTCGRQGAIFDFYPHHAIVSVFAIKNVIVLKKSISSSHGLHSNARAMPSAHVDVSAH